MISSEYPIKSSCFFDDSMPLFVRDVIIVQFLHHIVMIPNHRESAQPQVIQNLLKSILPL